MHCDCHPRPAKFIHIGLSVFGVCSSCRVYWHQAEASQQAIDGEVKRLGGLDLATVEWTRRASDMLRDYQPHEPPSDDIDKASESATEEIPF